MSVTASDIKTRVLADIGDQPYTADSALGTKVEAIVIDCFNHIQLILRWLKDDHEQTWVEAATTSVAVNDQLRAVAYNLSMASVLTATGSAQRASVFWELYQKEIAEIQAMRS